MAMEKSKCTPAARASKKIILPDPRYTGRPYSLLRDFRRRAGACGSIARRRRRMARRRRTSPHFLPLPSLPLPLLFFSPVLFFLRLRRPFARFEIPISTRRCIFLATILSLLLLLLAIARSPPRICRGGNQKCLQTAAMSKVDARTFGGSRSVFRFLPRSRNNCAFSYACIRWRIDLGNELRYPFRVEMF